jgi:hypothetical protein
MAADYPSAQNGGSVHFPKLEGRSRSVRPSARAECRDGSILPTMRWSSPRKGQAEAQFGVPSWITGPGDHNRTIVHASHGPGGNVRPATVRGLTSSTRQAASGRAR